MQRVFRKGVGVRPELSDETVVARLVDQHGVQEDLKFDPDLLWELCDALLVGKNRVDVHRYGGELTRDEGEHFRVRALAVREAGLQPSGDGKKWILSLKTDFGAEYEFSLSNSVVEALGQLIRQNRPLGR